MKIEEALRAFACSPVSDRRARQRDAELVVQKNVKGPTVCLAVVRSYSFSVDADKHGDIWLVTKLVAA